MISYFLCFQMVLALGIQPSAKASSSTTSISPDQNNDQQLLTNSIVDAVLEMKQPTLDILKFTADMENGNLENQKFSDPFYQALQFVTINSVVYHIANSKQQRPPKINKNDLTFKMRTQGKILIFEGIYGANTKGENGKIVASHSIPFPNEIISTTGLNSDNDLIMILTKDGSVSAISRKLLFDSIFEPGLPVFSKIWEVDPENSKQVHQFNSFIAKYDKGNIQIRSHFLTRSTHPEYLNDTENALVIPEELKLDLAQGVAADALSHQAGNYYIGWTDKNSSENAKKSLLAIIPRKTIFLAMLRGALLMQQQDYVLHPDMILKRPEVTDLLKKMEAHFDNLADDVEEKDISPLVKLVLDKKTDNERLSLETTINSIMTSLKSRDPVDQFNSQEAASFLSKAIAQSNNNVNTEEQIENNFTDFAKLQATPLNDPLKTKNLLADLITSPAAKINELFLKKIPNSEARTYIGYALAGGTYLGYAYFYQATGGYEFPILTWIYDHGYPPVIKNMATVNVAVAGLIAGISIMPILQGATWLSGLTFREVSKMFQSSNSKWAQNLRSFANDWKLGDKDQNNNIKNGSSVWQLLMASCLRVSAIFTFPILRAIGNSGTWIATDIIRQKSILTAVQNGINPFDKVTSLNGETRRIGINNPFLSQSKLETLTQENKQLQTNLKEENHLKKSLALTLALVVVGEQAQISPGQLMASLVKTDQNKDFNLKISENKKSLNLSIKQLENLISNPETRDEIKLLEQVLFRDLQKASAKNIISALDPKDSTDFLIYYRKAKEISDHLNNSSSALIKETTRYLWIQFQATMKAALITAANNGYEDSVKMWNMKARQIDSAKLGLVTSEITTDMLFAGFYSALVGPFADPTHPDRLFGKSTFPYLSDTGIFSTAENGSGQLTLGGPSALMALDPLIIDKENSYRPIQEYTLSQQARTEGLSTNFFKELYRDHNFKVSDLGGWHNKYFFKRWGSFFQYLILSGFILRIASFQDMHITMTEAFGSFMAYELAKWMYYRPIWTYIRVGNMVNQNHYRENLDKLNQYKLALSRMTDSENTNQVDLDTMHTYYQDILNIYWKSNPSVMKKILKLTKKNLTKTETLNIIKTVTKEKFEDYGIAFQLLQATKELEQLETQPAVQAQTITEQKMKIENLQNQLIDTIANSNSENNEPMIANIKGLIELIRTNPPYVTKSHDQYHSIKVLLAGAIGTTILGLQLQDITTVGNFMHDPAQWAQMALESGAFMFGFWGLTSKKAWDYYSEKWEQFKKVKTALPLVVAEKITDFTKNKKRTTEPYEYSVKNAVFCSEVFKFK
jgi:hypothetical protein